MTDRKTDGEVLRDAHWYARMCAILLWIMTVGSLVDDCAPRLWTCDSTNLGEARIVGTDFYKCAEAPTAKGKRYRFVRASP